MPVMSLVLESPPQLLGTLISLLPLWICLLLDIL